jgi:hypothetical protein
MRVLALAVIAAVHGMAQAAAARLLGDPGPARDGRATADPLAHLSFLGGALFVLFAAGWIVPVRLDRTQLRGGAAGILAVVGVGIAAVLLLGWLSAFARWPIIATLPDSVGMTVGAFIGVFGELCVAFAVVNALPIPPLTAGALWQAMPGVEGTRYDWLVRVGAAILVVAIGTGWLTQALAGLQRSLGGLVL